MGPTCLLLCLLLWWTGRSPSAARRIAATHLVLTLTCIALGAQAFNGAMLNDSAWFLCFLPLLASYQLGVRQAIAWTGLSVLVVVGLSALSLQIQVAPEHTLSFTEVARNRVVFIVLVAAFAVAARRAGDRLLKRATDGENRLASVFRQTSEGLLTIDPEGLIEKINPAAVSMFGYSAEEELRGRHLCVLIPELKAKPSEYCSLEQGQRWPKLIGRRDNGSEFPVSFSLSAVGFEEGLLFSGVLTDISKSEAVARVMLQAKEEAEAANQAKSQFLASMSHELRTPLNSIIGFSEMLIDEVPGPLNSKQKRYQGNIHDNGRHLLALVNDILDLARIESGQIELSMTEIELRGEVEQTLEHLRSLVEEKRISVEIDSRESVSVFADPGRLRQILINLVGNSVKFTPNEGTVRIVLESLQDKAQVTIIDSGIGIASDDLERIFHKFQQADGRYSREHQGTGLGLTLSRELVEMQGGRIWAESEGEGKGSRFFFTLPLFEAQTLPESNSEL